jgi:cytochrome P450
MFVKLIARATSSVVGGETLRRNEKWLNIASNYSINVGTTVFLLRPFPAWLRPLIAPFLPCVRAMKEQLRVVKNDIFVPMILERRAAEQANGPVNTKPDDFLQWMMDMEEEEEDRDPDLLAHHLLILMSLAVVHTSAMAMCQALYDLVLMPEYLVPLRDEIRRTLRDGWENATQASFVAQRRMDSFLRESQRFNPPGERVSSIHSSGIFEADN